MIVWGSGLFESDYDIAGIEELDEAAGLFDLERAANEQPLTNGVSSSDDDSNAPHVRHSYSMYSDRCKGDEDRRTVRNHLDSGVLATVLAELQQRSAQNVDGREVYAGENVYRIFILGACAMTHGCRLEPGFLNLMITMLPSLPNDSKALQQMQSALDPTNPDRYSNDGTPHDFYSLPRPGMEELDDEYPEEVLQEVMVENYVALNVAARQSESALQSPAISPPDDPSNNFDRCLPYWVAELDDGEND